MDSALCGKRFCCFSDLFGVNETIFVQVEFIEHAVYLVYQLWWKIVGM